MSIVWTIIIGSVAGVVAKLLHPGPNEYHPGQGTGFGGATVGRLSFWLYGHFSRRAAPFDRKQACPMFRRPNNPFAKPPDARGKLKRVPQECAKRHGLASACALGV